MNGKPKRRRGPLWALLVACSVAVTSGSTPDTTPATTPDTEPDPDALALAVAAAAGTYDITEASVRAIFETDESYDFKSAQGAIVIGDDGSVSGEFTYVTLAISGEWVTAYQSVDPGAAVELGVTGAALNFEAAMLVHFVIEPPDGDTYTNPGTQYRVSGLVDAELGVLELTEPGADVPRAPFRFERDAAAEQSEEAEEVEVGVIERDGIIMIVAPPDGVLELTSADLPPEIYHQLVTVGQMYATAGPPMAIVEGDERVLLDGLPLVRLGDGTATGGAVTDGSNTILINGVPAATVGGNVADPLMIAGGLPAVGGPILARWPCIDETGACVPDDYPEPIDVLGHDALAGDDRVTLVDDRDFNVGDVITIGQPDVNIEVRTVTDQGSLILDRPLEFDHPIGDMVTRVPDRYASLAESAEEGTEPIPTPPSNAVPAEQGAGADDGSNVPIAVALVVLVLSIVALGWWLRRRALTRADHPSRE